MINVHNVGGVSESELVASKPQLNFVLYEVKDLDLGVAEGRHVSVELRVEDNLVVDVVLPKDGEVVP